MNNFKINGTDPDNIMSKGQQVDRIYSKGTLVWEKSFPEVTIGTQTWKVKNLDIDDGGDGIYAYNNDENNVTTYGYLYTWDAAMRVADSIDGWHLPTDAEWTTLTDYLGGESVAGGKLKETGTTHWRSPNIGATNESDFTALPLGIRNSNGSFDGIGNTCNWWCATERNASNAWNHSMHSDFSNVYRNYFSKELGYSVRLIKDYLHTPTITLLGDNPVTISVGDTYTDAGATAHDTRYGDITSGIVTVNNVNTSVAGTYIVTYNITTEDGNSAEEVVRTVVVEEIKTIWGTEIVEVTNPVTGRIWMDRNIGATRAATSSTDSEAYGHLFQWGRNPDGHELRTSGTNSVLSTTDVPGHGDFIIGSGNWRSPRNDNLWQGVIADGWRLPTNQEWLDEIATWESENSSGAYNSVLKLPVAGLRNSSIGSLYNVGSYGYYWSSTVNGTLASNLHFFSSNAYMNSNYRAHGFSVRLIKDYSHTPTITLFGDSAVTISVGDTYTDAGATAHDDRYGDITSDIVVVNNVNTSVAGTYTVTYNVTTEDGYSAEEVVRNVVVEENSFNPEEVTIGTQTWKVKNLDIDDGGEGIYAYNNDESNVATYGRLYTWDAAVRVAASIDGWHLPTNDEWTTLTTYLGGESVAGGKLKETGTTHWNSPNTGATNETGFTALSGGCRFTNGTFNHFGSYGHWWSATEFNTSNAWRLTMYNYYSSVLRGYYSKELGFSVRLIRD